MRSLQVSPLVRRAPALILAIVLGASLLVAPIAGASHGATECPEIMPVAEVQEGMVGVGYTVVRGKTPTTFNVEILGVLENGIGPGRDMIVVDVSGPPIDQARGIWFGMSGSPVYVGERLVGAVAFGLSFGPSSIGGLTPAEDMADILAYERNTSGGQAAAPSSASRYQRSIRLPDAMVRRIARHEQVSNDEVSNEMRQLRLPVSVSGLTGRGLERVSKVLKREGHRVVTYAGSSAAATTPGGTTTRVVPGGNFAAAISYGDITFAGVGTTTYVCEDVALAFGHPFFFLPTGATLVGANDADAIAIVDDPTFGPYKLASIAERVGTVDQDRFAGIRTLFGFVPPTIPTTSNVTALTTGRSRQGTTEIVTSEYVPFLAAAHVFSNIDFTFDEIGEGKSSLDWTIRGTREDGSTWELSRSNLYASDFDISIESVFELQIQLFTLFMNRFEEIEFSGLDVTASVDDEAQAYRITNVLTSKDGVDYRDVRRVRSRPGKTVYLRVELTPLDESLEPRVVDLSLVIPETAKSDALIEITSGASSYEELFCFLNGSRCADEAGNKIETFDQLIAYLESRPKNNELLARLRMGGRGRVKATDREMLDQVIRGRKRVFVSIIGACCAGEGEVVTSEPKPEGQPAQ
ncbi:MAG TPA: SpoIVB peptidase S55 domain-containing protein [Actinomycetota bacterium]|nr:SpoIVB peptidase S55 domain-containing protein [Actinomycetota bacterium]